MTLNQALEEKLKLADTVAIAKAMGYRKAQVAKFQARLNITRTIDNFGLGNSNYDFKYSNKEFLFALCRTLKIDIKLCRSEIEKIEREIDKERSTFKPFIFVDTDFVRANQPIFVLAFLEGKRFIELDRKKCRMPLSEQVVHVCNLARKHFMTCSADPNHSMAPWGKIRYYLFYYAQDRALQISSDGKVIGEVRRRAPARAHLTAKGKDMAPLFPPADSIDTE